MRRFFTSLGVAVLGNGAVLLAGTGAWGVYKFFEYQILQDDGSIAFFGYVELAGLLVAGAAFIAHMITYKKEEE